MIESLSPLSRLAIGLLLVLLLPRLVGRVRLPGAFGFILAGVVMGPGLTGILKSDSPSIEIWAELGKLLFMFFVGFETDLDDFNKVKQKAFVFGIMTFAFPFVAGTLTGYLLGYSENASALIGAIIASHTILTHSILKRLGLIERESMLVAVGGTIFTDISSMLALALDVSIYKSGFSWTFLFSELVELAIYVPLVLFGLSKIARNLISRFGETPEARVSILLMLLAIAAQLAELIQLEGIVGAFLSGIAIKRAVKGNFGVEQLDVMAKALFIPTFFLAIGFLIDFSLLAETLTSRPQIVIGLFLALSIGKWIAASLASYFYSLPKLDQKLMFSVTLPQMAATLSSAVVGYNTKNAQGERLFDLEFVNAIVVLVIVTCVIGPMLTERWGRQLSMAIADEPKAG